MGTAIVSEPFAHLIPTGSLWAEGFRSLGWKVEERRQSEGAPTNWPDLLVVMDTPGSLLTSPSVLSAAPKDVKIVGLVSDEPSFAIEPLVGRVTFFSHTLRHDRLDAVFHKVGGVLHHLAFGGSERVFGSCVPRETPRFDCCFIGSNYHGDRQIEKYIAPLINAGLLVFLAGCCGWPTVPYASTPTFYMDSKICLNIHRESQKLPDRVELNARTYDLGIAGAFQVCDQDALPSVAPITLACSVPALWPGTVLSLLEDHDYSELRSTAARMRELALETHTWRHRMAEVLRLVDLH